MERILTVWGREPARLESVKIGSADTAVGDLNVNIILFPLLGLELLPLHLALNGLLIETEPSLELVVGARHV